jgi:hypothetical protein
MASWVRDGLSTAVRASSRGEGRLQGVWNHTLGFAQVRWSVAPVAEVFGEQNGSAAADRGLGDQASNQLSCSEIAS